MQTSPEITQDTVFKYCAYQVVDCDVPLLWGKTLDTTVQSEQMTDVSKGVLEGRS